MAAIPLHAGPFRLVLLPEDGSLRYLMAGEHEVLRGIAAPVRDQAWATIRPQISELNVAQREKEFTVTFVARCRQNEIDFLWRGRIAGTAEGTITYDFDGEARSDFLRNRIGFCVLHPAELQGASCVVEHVDDRIENGAFPQRILTGAPFANIRALTHHVAPGVAAEVRLEGDTFEMEDQRNWTDASFKTYCTPLGLPRPVRIAKGTRIQQRITVRLVGSPPAVPAGFCAPWESPPEVEVTVGDAPIGPLPALGVNLPSADVPPAVIDALRPLGLAHLRVDLWLADPAHVAKLKAAARVAEEMNVALELAVFVDDSSPDQLTRLRETLASFAPAPRIARWLVFHETTDATPPSAVAAMRQAFTGTPFAAPIGGGATDNFTELNYHPSVADVADFTVHACNPQVHAFDEASIVETLAMQGITVANARALSAGKPSVVSPVTLTRRWRLNDAGAPGELPAGLLPFQTDPRHAAPFNAAWTLGSLASLASAGAHSLTYFETHGENGLVDARGTPLPVYYTFAALDGWQDATVLPTSSSHPLHIATLALVRGDRRILHLANLRPQPQVVRITTTSGSHRLELPAHSIRSIPV